MDNLHPAKPRLGISSCLLGHKVRFDGGHKRDVFLTDLLGKFVEWITVCPEFEVGMGIPRESVRLTGNPSAPSMVAERSGKDWTEAMNRFSAHRVSQLRQLDLSGYVFKKNSPSCGMERVRVYSVKGMPARQGRGLFASALMNELPLLPCEEEGRLGDSALRENFIERVFAYRRWQDLHSTKKSLRALIEFHTRHKFLLLAHDETRYRRLGRIVAAAKKTPLAEVYNDYGHNFMQALTVRATAKKHVNVLEHMLGYCSPQLSPDERQEMISIIHDFRRGMVPLIVPVTLLRHYIKKYQVTYLLDQFYLEPNPKELMLRNHV